jgi:hypothetical protein
MAVAFRTEPLRTDAHVLLVEEGWHSTLYLASALDAAGFAVTVLTANGARASCRCRGVRWTSGPALDDPRFVDHVDRMMPFDRVLPLTEAAMARLWGAGVPWRDRIFPETAQWQRRLVRDKHALIDHMAARGIRVPRQRRLAATTPPRAIIDEFGIPVVVKGATGSGGRRVRIATSLSELDHALRRSRMLGGEWVAQELIAGPTLLFGGVFRDGRALRLYAGEKLELYPRRTGGAIRLRSIDDRALVDAGVRVMRELRWTGLASADFMRSPDGEPVLLEVNPRLWGSLAGTLSAGVDLFGPFCELLAGGDPAPELGYLANDECWIFPRYLNTAAHRDLAGLARALRDLFGVQGRDWRNPRMALHILYRLYRMGRLAERL